jgi:NAD(P)H-dependent flavin oxidoreductase YrpB (nitropropane dioxygenase family)
MSLENVKNNNRVIRFQISNLFSGMSCASVPKMLATVSNAGGVGILATDPLTRENTNVNGSGCGLGILPVVQV